MAEAESMDKSDVCPNAIRAFLDFLVEPRLPARYSIRDTPNTDKQKTVAQQVYAVVLLYNYYHRKNHPNLKYLDFEAFGKMAFTLKPNLKAYLKLIPNNFQLSNIETQLSWTEKAIKDACDVSTSLDASRAAPNIKGWPVSRVAVLLIDKKKEACALQSDVITHGVCSVIEKKVDGTGGSSDSMKAKQAGNKRKRTNKLLQDAALEQVAFSAVKEAANNGIDQKDLTIIKSHDVYSLDKEEAATRFYIMHCLNGDIDSSKWEWMPIKVVIDRLQGPLVIETTSTWLHSSVVEYFHLLPYAQIISKWFSGEMNPERSQDDESVQEDVSLNGSQKTEKPGEPEVLNNTTTNQINDGLEEASINTNSAESETQHKNNEHCKNGILDDTIDGNMDVDNQSVGDSEKMLTSKNIAEKIQLDDDQLIVMNSCPKSDFDGTSTINKFKVVTPVLQNAKDCKHQNATKKEPEHNNMPSCQDGIFGGHLAINESKSKYSAKILKAIESKEDIFSETALQILYGKRDERVLQVRNMGDEIAEYDQMIQKIFNGGRGDELDLKMNLILECCKDELDIVCQENNWVLPTYHVFPSDGGFQAKVTVKGLDFETSVGDACPKAHQARVSAAAQLLTKWRSMST
ncbi:hypothetical protein CCACVL1_08537 [Corchorus capsularis]|uniref:DRBM domain-containing protein n=1 Tax=Corchorus capsularis TaxID=210143 RepID=A0A1R3J029_COCAP|nr:hypothetical protein CCACVL1_08537 [Corchorus capsularis]